MQKLKRRALLEIAEAYKAFVETVSPAALEREYRMKEVEARDYQGASAEFRDVQAFPFLQSEVEMMGHADLASAAEVISDRALYAKLVIKKASEIRRRAKVEIAAAMQPSEIRAAVERAVFAPD